MSKNQGEGRGGARKSSSEERGLHKDQKDQEHLPGRGSQRGSGDQRELQDQEEFDRGNRKGPTSPKPNR